MGHGKYIDPFEISPRAPLGRNDNDSVISSEVEESHVVGAGEYLALEYVILPGYFLPLPHGQGSFLPTFFSTWIGCVT